MKTLTIKRKVAQAITPKQHQTHLNINLAGLTARLGLPVAQAIKPADMGLIEIYTTKIRG